MDTNVCPKTWLAESILATIFCCLPFGVVGIVYAAKVSSLFAAGNIEAAEEASRNAKKWTLIGCCVGIVGILLYILFCVVLGFSAMNPD